MRRKTSPEKSKSPATTAATKVGPAVAESRNTVLNELRNLTVTREYPRGTVLFVEGQRSTGVYALRDGRAKVTIASAEGRTLVLRIARPGDLLGINATLTGQPYGATVQTIERCRADFIARADLLKLLARDKNLYAELTQVLSRKLSNVVEHVRLLVLSHSVLERLARLLVGWCDELGTRTTRGIRIDSGLTHEDMAQMICASRETVTRAFSELKRNQIVSLVDNAIFVRNRNALEALANY
jgi:CRP/FNR family transcriptional regulator, cyclic AMP receptor protein